MSIAKVKNSSVLNGMKLEEGNDSLNTLVRQAIGTEPFLSFPRSADSSMQWFQFLNSLDNQDLPGWPLLSPIKLPMQKCDKCSREFFSTINYRRHVRVHHRVKKLDKDTAKNRDLLAAFWDKLSLDEAKETVSLKNSTLEDAHGATVIKALASLIRKPGFPSVPQICLRAGSALLDIIQARPSRFPLSSEELFSILDDASEKTFLSGPANSMQKYIFDGEAGKISMETKNLVAFTCFSLEQKLVKAWLANKDAEALRCQELLVEEEEAAQKRQAHILERKRQKKLRQKELKAKHRNDKANNADGFDTVEAEHLTETPGSPEASGSDVDNIDALSDNVHSLHKKPELPDTQQEADSSSRSRLGSLDAYQNVEPSARHAENSHQHLGTGNWHASRKARFVSNSSHEHQIMLKHKHGNWGSRPAYTVSGKKVWSRKPKPESEELDLKFRVKEEFSRADQDKKHEVLIGSIAVSLVSCDNQHEIDYLGGLYEDSPVEYGVHVYSSHEKLKNVVTFSSGTNQPRQKLWRPVSRHETEDSMHIQDANREPEFDVPQIANDDGATTVDGNDGWMECRTLLTEADSQGATWLSSHAAKEFLSQRWKEAISGEHLKLVLYPEPEAPASAGTENDCKGSLDLGGGNEENRVVNENIYNALATGTAKFKLKTKQEKGFKKKYIPKQRVNT